MRVSISALLGFRLIASVHDMYIQQLLNCQISKWSPQFRQVTYRTKLIDLPANFVNYLTADGIFLPEGSAAVSLFDVDGRRMVIDPYCSSVCILQTL